MPAGPIRDLAARGTEQDRHALAGQGAHGHTVDRIVEGSLDLVAVMIHAENPIEPEDVVVEIEAAAPEETVTPIP